MQHHMRFEPRYRPPEVTLRTFGIRVSRVSLGYVVLHGTFSDTGVITVRILALHDLLQMGPPDVDFNFSLRCKFLGAFVTVVVEG